MCFRVTAPSQRGIVMSSDDIKPSGKEIPLSPEDNAIINQAKILVCQIMHQFNVKPSLGTIAMFECISYVAANSSKTKEEYDRLIQALARTFVYTSIRNYEQHLKDVLKSKEAIATHPKGAVGVAQDTARSFNTEVIVLQADSQEEINALIKEELKKREAQSEVPPKNKLH